MNLLLDAGGEGEDGGEDGVDHEAYQGSDEADDHEGDDGGGDLDLFV